MREIERSYNTVDNSSFEAAKEAYCRLEDFFRDFNEKHIKFGFELLQFQKNKFYSLIKPKDEKRFSCVYRSIHTYAVYYDAKTKTNNAVALTHLYVKDDKRFKQVNLELKEVKKVCYSANQKNDLFDAELKMMGHAANVRNKCFVRFVCDEQRPESWGANARELASIVRIEERGEQCIAMPFYEVRDLLYAFLSDRFKSFYLEYRFARGDISLLFYLYSNFFAAIYKTHLRNYNTFGYSPVKVQTEKGTLDGVRDEHEYYYLNKKIYSSRFATDGFSGFYYNKTIKYGIGDMPCYADIHATEAELEKQNSYFVRDLTAISGDEENGIDERF